MDEYTGASAEYTVTTRRENDEPPEAAPPPGEDDLAGVAPSADPAPDLTLSHHVTERPVYALGQIGYDFATQTRRDSVKQRMGDDAEPEEARDMLAHLDENPADAESLQWTLNLQSIPIYFLEPRGPYAAQTYELLRTFLREQLEEGVERVSIPGTIAGVGHHRSGASIPIVVPALRGMYSWTTEALVSAVADAGATTGKAAKGAADQRDAVRGGVTNFLERVYYEIRNLGIEPRERAINFAATNAFSVESVYEHAVRENMELDTIDVEPSPLCPPNSDCWDVKLTFFFPDRPAMTPRRVYRFTVDVADVVPATIGSMRTWAIR
ncbi:cyanobactin maturation protease PatG family protein [Actinomadura harenae]|uniref:Peptidase n=1 Tax=Actinomadura harenae TaxID=2483351 RepID=A0A3M2LN97_9ACTN|nr:peptidase [Actinomadura harenae]RMI38944.1 peptidase [Actinomadura harenae]